MAIQLRLAGGDSKTKTKSSLTAASELSPPTNVNDINIILTNGNGNDHSIHHTTTTTPPSHHQHNQHQQQCQQRRNNNNNNSNNHQGYSYYYKTTPNPETSPEISKLWMTTSSLSSGESDETTTTPRRVLSYKSATTTSTSTTSTTTTNHRTIIGCFKKAINNGNNTSSSRPSSPLSLSLSSSPPPKTTTSPQHIIKKQRRQRSSRRLFRCRVLLTGIVGVSTWMYLSFAYFALSQWYFLDNNRQRDGKYPTTSSTQTDNNNNKYGMINDKNNKEMMDVFAYQPSSVVKTQTTHQSNERNETIRRTRKIRDRNSNNHNNEEKYNDPLNGFNNNDNKSPRNHPRIVHYTLDHSSSFGDASSDGNHHDINNNNFLLPILLVGRKRDTLNPILLPSSSTNINKTSTTRQNITTTFLEEDEESRHGEGMGFHDIIRGNTTKLSQEDEDDDDEEEKGGGGGSATEEKSFVVLSDSNSTTVMNNNHDDDKNVVNSGDNDDDDDNPPQCTAMQDWQTRLLVTCNNFHELDWYQPKFLAQGWFRDTWKYDDEMVLKTLRYEREYLDEYYELHRRDAIAMEHLTFSAFVLNIYGHCGQSALNEYAAGVGDVNSLEVLDRRLRGKENRSWRLKLRLATSVAVGLVHIQYGPPSVVFGHNRNVTLLEILEDTTTPASMAHYDINPRNIAIIPGGRPKLNDFNVAEFLTIPNNNNSSSNNVKTISSKQMEGDHHHHPPTCGKFRSRLHDPWWRAPEEMNTNSTSFVDEAVDVYALGNVLFHILTTHSPRGKMKKDRAVEVRKQVSHGKRPELPSPYNDINNKKVDRTVLSAFHMAFDLCFEPDPTKRGTSKEVALVLHDAYQKVLATAKMQQEEI